MANLLFLSMSTIGKEVDPSTFVLASNQEIVYPNCQGQLEPIAMHFIKNSMDTDVVFVVLCTTATLNESTFKVKEDQPVSYTISPYEFFKHRIDQYAKEQGYTHNIQYKCVEIPDINQTARPLNQAVDFIRDWKKDNNESGKFWVDNHGGFRQISMLMDAIISLLAVDDISPEKVFSVEYDKTDKINTIIDSTQAFGIFEFVTGMNDFFNFGDAKLLLDFYKNTQDANIKKMLEGMKQVSDGTKMSNSEDCVAGYNKIWDAVSLIEKSGVKDDYINIFIVYIKSDFGDVLNDESKRKPLVFVDSCFRREQYQQALTFLESLMPSQIMDSLFINDIYEDDIAAAANDSGKGWAEVDNYLFDKIISRFYYFNCTRQEKNQSDNTVKARIRSFSQFYENTVKKGDTHFINKPIPNIKTGIPRDFRLGRNSPNYQILKVDSCSDIEYTRSVTRFLILHHALKQCRNMLNHGKTENRPENKDIINCLGLYLAYANELLNKNVQKCFEVGE